MPAGPNVLGWFSGPHCKESHRFSRKQRFLEISELDVAYLGVLSAQIPTFAYEPIQYVQSKQCLDEVLRGGFSGVGRGRPHQNQRTHGAKSAKTSAECEWFMNQSNCTGDYSLSKRKVEVGPEFRLTRESLELCTYLRRLNACLPVLGGVQTPHACGLCCLCRQRERPHLHKCHTSSTCPSLRLRHLGNLPAFALSSSFALL